jgi:hypothetical protein
MPPVGFEPTIPASAQPQTYVLDSVATGIGALPYLWMYFVSSQTPTRLKQDHTFIIFCGLTSKTRKTIYVILQSQLLAEQKIYIYIYEKQKLLTSIHSELPTAEPCCLLSSRSIRI